MVNEETTNQPVFPVLNENENTPRTSAKSKGKSIFVVGGSSRAITSVSFSFQTLIYLGTSIALAFLHAYQEIAWNFTFEREYGSYHASVASWPWPSFWPTLVVTRELYIALWIDAVLHASTYTSSNVIQDGSPLKGITTEMFKYWMIEKSDENLAKEYMTEYGEFKYYYAPAIDRSKYKCVVMGWVNTDRTSCHLKGDDDTVVDIYGIMDNVLAKMYKLQCQTDIGVDPTPEIAADFDSICKKMVVLDKLGALTGKSFLRLIVKGMGYDDIYIGDLERDIEDPYSYTQMAVRTVTIKVIQSIAEQQDMDTHATYVPTLRTANTTLANIKEQIEFETIEEILTTGELDVYSQSWKYKNVHYAGTLPVLACSGNICERHVGDVIMDEPSNSFCFTDSIMESVRQHRIIEGQYDQLVAAGVTQGHVETCLRMRDERGTCSYDNFARGTNYMGLCQRGQRMEVPSHHVESDWTGHYTTSKKPNSQIYVEFPVANNPEYNPEGKYDRQILLVDAGGMSYTEYNNRLTLSPIAQWMVFCIIMLIISFRNGSPQLVGQYLYNSVIVELCGCLLWLDYYYAFYGNKARKIGAFGMGGSTDLNIDDIVLRFHGIVGYFALCQWGGKFGGGKMTSLVTTTGNTLLSVFVGIGYMIYNQNYIRLLDTSSQNKPKHPGCSSLATQCYYTENASEIPISGIITFFIGYILTSLMRVGLKNAKFARVKEQSIVSNYFFDKVHDHDLKCNIIFEIDRLLFIEAPTQRYSKELGLSPSQFLVDTGLLALLGYVIVDGRIVRQRDVMTVLIHAITPSIILSDSKLTYTYWLITDLKPESGKHVAVYTKFGTHVNKDDPKQRNWKKIQAIM